MEKEVRLIDANALNRALIEEYHGMLSDETLKIYQAIRILDECPTVDAVEVVHGRWQNNANDYPECDKCGYMPQYDPMIDDIWYSPYCPHCGAKMDGDGND